MAMLRDELAAHVNYCTEVKYIIESNPTRAAEVAGLAAAAGVESLWHRVSAIEALCNSANIPRRVAEHFIEEAFQAISLA